MTDRQVGQAGARVEVQADAARLLGQGGLTVDYQPYADIPPPRDPIFTRLGVAGLTLEIVPSVGRRLGQGGLLVDFVPGAVATGIQWGAGAFQPSGGAYAPVMWSPDQFAFAGGTPVDWSGDHFELVE